MVSFALSAPAPMRAKLAVMKEHQSAVRRWYDKPLLALHCLTVGHAFDWTRASVVARTQRRELGSLLRPETLHQRALTSASQ